MRSLFSIILVVASIFVSSTGLAQAPDSLSFQGVLTDTDGVPVADGTYNLLTKMYKGSTEIWEQNHTGVPVSGGVFSIILSGTLTHPLDTVAFNQPIDLGITVNGENEITPRTPLTAAAFARGMPGMYTFRSEDEDYTGVNVVGGAANNVVHVNAVGATISGGGGYVHLITPDTPAPNSVLSSFGTIAGGRENTVSGVGSTIGGGTGNTSAGVSSTIAGGQNNTTYNNNGTIGGGGSNRTSGSFATIGGGVGNKASGSRATIPGGRFNQARGDYSFAAGNLARAKHDGTFVWAGSAEGDLDSLVTTANEQFLIRADGGVGIGTNAPQNDSQLHVEHGSMGTDDWGVVVTNSTTAFRAGMRISDTGFFEITNNANANGPNFAQLNSTGGWTAVSDRRLKTDIEPASDLLDAALELEPVRYHFKNLDDQAVKTLGVIGQQVQDVVPSLVAEGELVTVNYAGLSVVAIGAIQELYGIVQEQQAALAKLEAENQRMRAAIETMD